MTHSMRAAMTALMLLFASCGGGCAGYQASQHVLMPALRKTWSGEFGLRFMAARQAELVPDPAVAHAHIAKADAAIETGMDSLFIAVEWGRVDELIIGDIERRVDEGEIPNGVAQSAFEALHKFQDGRNTIIQGIAR